MTDVVDQAQEDEAVAWTLRQAAAAERQGNGHGPSAFFCADCEIEISPERRKAQPGCQRCAQCQAIYESLKKRGLA